MLLGSVPLYALHAMLVKCNLLPPRSESEVCGVIVVPNLSGPAENEQMIRGQLVGRSGRAIDCDATWQSE
jgi:hypothetical protein